MAAVSLGAFGRWLCPIKLLRGMHVATVLLLQQCGA